MIAQPLAASIAHAPWKAALVALIALAGLLLPQEAEAQATDQVIIMIRGTGNQVTERVQVGERCRPGARTLVYAKVRGGGRGIGLTATAQCSAGSVSSSESPSDEAARCSADTSQTVTETCNAVGSQPPGRPTPRCDYAYAKGQAPGPDAAWRVTCVFNL